MNRRNFTGTTIAGLGTLSAIENIAEAHTPSFEKSKCGFLKKSCHEPGYERAEFWRMQSKK